MALHNGPFEAQKYSYCDSQIFTTRRIPRMGSGRFRLVGRIWHYRNVLLWYKRRNRRHIALAKKTIDVPFISAHSRNLR